MLPFRGLYAWVGNQPSIFQVLNQTYISILTKIYSNEIVFCNFTMRFHREDAADYRRDARWLVLTLVEAISQSLGLERDYPIKALGNHGQHMAINYCPLCPQPELTYGLPCQTDPNVITILLQDDVPGLQVLINGRWVAVNPISRTFTVNIGGQIQVTISRNMVTKLLLVPLKITWVSSIKYMKLQFLFIERSWQNLYASTFIAMQIFFYRPALCRYSAMIATKAYYIVQ